MSNDNELGIESLLCDAFCINKLGLNNLNRIKKHIGEDLPSNLSDKIVNITFSCFECDYLELYVHVLDKDIDLIYPALNGVYPDLDWRLNNKDVSEDNVTYISLIIDDDVLISLPNCVFD